MKHSTQQHLIKCNCRSVGECTHNSFAWMDALDSLIDDFSRAMKHKLRKKFMEGREGWDDPNWSKEQIMQALKEHANESWAGYNERGESVHKEVDPVDVANFAAFLWNRMD